ncbi:phasin family protein [Pseudoxanthomonas putridarboris]|uniref:Phasin family protein n=1 Tax=Pseudoxanthomonas putridarboris TaxID=752605 RepID=A0ABU9IXV9_9GAMM
MSGKTELPLSLFKANIELQTRINRLAQQGGQQWLDLSNRLLGDGIAESNAEIEELLKTEDWQTLATLPAESFWRQLQQRFGDSQAAVQIAVSAQTAFANGLQEALRAWQKETAEALGSGGIPGAPFADAWEKMFAPWEQLFQAAASASADAPEPEPAAAAAAKKAAKGGGRGK